MLPSFFRLPEKDQLEALETAAERSATPVHLLEKDIWVVWSLERLFALPFAESLTFKGGTSLSKVYHAIQRFSEDIDLTYDIRRLIPDKVGRGDDWLPPSRSKASDATEAVRERLPEWIAAEVVPPLTADAEELGLSTRVRAKGEQVHIEYEALTRGTGYVAHTVRLEFGARATGEPNHRARVFCDAAQHLAEIEFPSAEPLTMAVERTFWEKATAVHVYCHQGRFRGPERFARHWYDLSRLDRVGLADSALRDRAVAEAVAAHKTKFFREKDSDDNVIDYMAAVSGELRLVPSDAAYRLLDEDYGRMVEDGLLLDEAEPFQNLMNACRALEDRANRR